MFFPITFFPFTPLPITVPAHAAAVEYRHGVFSRVLGPGRHKRRWGTRHTVVDLRESLLTVAPQEVLTADLVSVRVSATLRWAVVDPVLFLGQSADPQAALYLATQVALRDALAGQSVEDLVTRGTGPGAASISTEAITGAVASVGETLGARVAEVVLKDVIVPVELRAAALELATARSRGAAQLEAARAETAALRSLANGARILDASPALTRLRLVQAMPPGGQLVLQVSPE